jgi:hypothetical protein
LSNKRIRLREVKADMIGHTNELIQKRSTSGNSICRSTRTTSRNS